MTPPTSSRFISLVVALCAAAVSLSSERASAEPAHQRVVGVHIVSQVNGASSLPDDKPKRALAEDGVTLYAVLEVEVAGRRLLYSDAGVVRLRGKKRVTLPMDQAPAATLVWYKVEPAVESLSNTETGSFRYERIEYSEVPVHEWLAKRSVAADVHPTLTPDEGDGVGTMRFKLVADIRGGAVATPGVEARRERASGGLTDAVHRVSLRRDDTFLGMMTEMFGQPYIWASAGPKASTHQSERLEGSDCADLMVYGARRKGYDIPYTWTGGLDEYTRVLAEGQPREDGVYVDQRGQPIPFTRPGDILLFPRHVGALVEDRGVVGVLDNRDVMMHTFFATPKEQPVAETPYANAPIQLIRWKRPVD